MDKWLNQRAELLRSAKSLIDARKSADQALSADDRAHLKSVEDQIGELDRKIDAARKDAQLAAKFAEVRPSGGIEMTDGSQGDDSALGDQSDFFSRRAAKSMANRLAKKAVKDGGVDGEKAVIAHLSDPVDKYLLQDVLTVSRFLANELT
ncbi:MULTISPECIES: hypothetical protein [Gordonia]|uniref:hypothetical protein n=1 Tax=Gordonia TaxID=2053 RepID=UPI0007E9C730|nr:MULTISPECIES: hypothetical protein [Gordonia]OBA57343.1 hypothetical protein A5777_07025 [Gordonia sp. 852002-10350_SCH5691597]OBC02067.1 hypothetical protein A5785_17025 [Gordonia sp. 852002-50395_SCH5434458]